MTLYTTNKDSMKFLWLNNYWERFYKKLGYEFETLERARLVLLGPNDMEGESSN